MASNELAPKGDTNSQPSTRESSIVLKATEKAIDIGMGFLSDNPQDLADIAAMMLPKEFQLGASFVLSHVVLKIFSEMFGIWHLRE